MRQAIAIFHTSGTLVKKKKPNHPYLDASASLLIVIHDHVRRSVRCRRATRRRRIRRVRRRDCG